MRELLEELVVALRRQAHAQGHRSAAVLRRRRPRHRARHHLGARGRQRRQALSRSRRHQFHRRQGSHRLPRSAARRAARVRRRQADPQAVEREEAGGRLAVVAAHAAATSTCRPAGRARRGSSTARSSSSTPCATLEPDAHHASTTTSTCSCIVHPKELPPAALYAIDQFAMRGGHILAFVDPNAQADQSRRRSQQPDGAVRAPTNPRTSSRCSPRGDSNSSPTRSWPISSAASRCRCAKASRPRSTSRSSGFDQGSMTKDVVTARLDSINMATAGSLKAVAGTQAHVRAADPDQRAGRPAARAAHRDDERPGHAARRLQAHGRAHRGRARLGQWRQRLPRRSAGRRDAPRPMR